MMKRKRFANWKKGRSPSKLRSMYTRSIADLSQKLYATMRINCGYNLAVFHILGNNVATILKKNARMYQSSTATRFHIGSRRWNALEVLKHLQGMTTIIAMLAL